MILTPTRSTGGRSEGLGSAILVQTFLIGPKHLVTRLVGDESRTGADERGAGTWKTSRQPATTRDLRAAIRPSLTRASATGSRMAPRTRSLAASTEPPYTTTAQPG